MLVPDGSVVRRSHLSSVLVLLGSVGGSANGEPASIDVNSRTSKITIVVDQLAHLAGWAAALGLRRMISEAPARACGTVSGWVVTIDYIDPFDPLGAPS